jgi:hypothetical protein
MEKQLREPILSQIGDKIRVRSGPYSAARGIIQAEVDGILEILLDEGSRIHVEPREITNYSLAARRAWQTMPKRAGRPQSVTSRKKMVSMRIDEEVWNRLGEAVELGLIPSREEAVNTWLYRELVILFSQEPPQNVAPE